MLLGGLGQGVMVEGRAGRERGGNGRLKLLGGDWLRAGQGEW